MNTSEEIHEHIKQLIKDGKSLSQIMDRYLHITSDKVFALAIYEHGKEVGAEEEHVRAADESAWDD